MIERPMKGPNYQNELEPGDEPASGPCIKVNSGGFQFSAAVKTTRLGSVEEDSRREKERTSAICDDKDMARHTDIHRDDVLDDNVSGTDTHRDDVSEVVVSKDNLRPLHLITSFCHLCSHFLRCKIH